MLLVDDDIAEPDERFRLVLSHPQGGVETWHSVAAITVVDDNDESTDDIFAAGFEFVYACF